MAANRKSGSFTSILLFFGLAVMGGAAAVAQEHPPIPVQVEVNTSQSLNFGAFTTGTAGGTISVDHSGNRTATGSIYELNIGDSPSAALFDLTANPGTIITITPAMNVKLQGSNGGEIYLTINSFSQGQTFITTAQSNQVNSIYVGGILAVGGPVQSPAGIYYGTFNLTFNHQ